MKNISRFLTLLVGVGLFSTLVGCVPNVTKTVEKAKIYIKHQRYAPAIDELKKAIDVSPENAASQYWMGHCYENLNEVEKSLYHYELAVKYGPSLEIAQMAYVNALYNDRQVENSLETLDRYLKHRQAAARDFQRLAESFLAKNMILHADLAIEAAIRVEPTNPRPLKAMITYFKAKGDDDNVRKYYKLIFADDMKMPLEEKVELSRDAARYGIVIKYQRIAPPVKKIRKKPSALELELDNLN